MKQWKKIILYSVLLAVLVGALIFASIYKNKSAENNVTPTPAIDPVVSIAEKDIATITVVNNFGTLVFTPGSVKTVSNADTVDWSISSPQNPKYDKSVIGGKIAYFTQIEAQSVITASSVNLSEYGLDKPVATVSIVLKSGEKKKLLYGNETASSGSQYVTVEGSGRICVTSITNAEAAMLRSMDFLDINVLNGIVLKDVKTLAFKRAKDHLDFTAKSNNDASADGQVPATWQINTPIQSTYSESFQTFLTELTSIVANSYVELLPKDFAKYGLDVPSYDITLSTDTKNVHLILGKSAGAGLLYAYSDSVDAVFTVSTGAMTSIDKPFLELISSFINVPPNIWEVTAIDLKIDGLTIHCDVKDFQDKTAGTTDFKVNGLDANVKDSTEKSYFRQFYQSVIGIRIDELDLTATPAYVPVITIDYTKSDGSVLKIAFVKRDEITYYVFIGGVYQKFYVSQSSFYSEKVGYEGVLPSYRILENAMKNQVSGVYK